MFFIALFFPASIALKISIKKERIERKKWYDWIFTYCMFAMLINTSVMAVISYVLGLDGLTISALESFSFFIVYTVMSCMSAVFWAVLTNILRKNIEERSQKKESSQETDSEE